MGSACLQSSCQSNEQAVYDRKDTSNSNLSITANSTMVFTYETYNDKHKVCKVGPIWKKLLHKKITYAQRKNAFFTQCNYSVIAM